MPDSLTLPIAMTTTTIPGRLLRTSGPTARLLHQTYHWHRPTSTDKLPWCPTSEWSTWGPQRVLQSLHLNTDNKRTTCCWTWTLTQGHVLQGAWIMLPYCQTVLLRPPPRAYRRAFTSSSLAQFALKAAIRPPRTSPPPLPCQMMLTLVQQGPTVIPSPVQMDWML